MITELGKRCQEMARIEFFFGGEGGILFKKESSYSHVFADQNMVVFQYSTTTTSISLRLWMAERCSWTTASVV